MTLEEFILKTIHSEVIQNQKTLLNHITKQGYAVDQPTLSRLFKKLKIQKHLGKYVSFDNYLTVKSPEENKIIAIPPNLIIIKTGAGFASAIGTTLDKNPIDGIAGTIAGDDTIFVAILPNFSIEAVKKELENKI